MWLPSSLLTCPCVPPRRYLAIFDADFEPPVDFLQQTVPHLLAQPELGFVQTRWECPSHSLLTWVQRILLMFHFDVEQRARSFASVFFNFNGTAGVFRISAMMSVGGWHTDSVVEDMDLSLRMWLHGWRSKYLPHIQCSNEVPPTLNVYKIQQFRWLAGPMQILRKCFTLILTTRRIGFWDRMYCLWFFARWVRGGEAQQAEWRAGGGQAGGSSAAGVICLPVSGSRCVSAQFAY